MTNDCMVTDLHCVSEKHPRHF